jgi:hypothetical protein
VRRASPERRRRRRRRQVGVGDVRHDAQPLGDARGVPPAVARRLDQLRMWRNLCDYEDRVANLALLSTAALRTARRVIDALT